MAEEPAHKRIRLESEPSQSEESSPQSPMTLTASGTSQAGSISINMLTESSTRQENQDQSTQPDRWSHHHHYDLRKWWGRMETCKEKKPVGMMDERKLAKPPKRNLNYHLAWFNLWWSRMAREAQKQAQSKRMLEFLNHEKLEGDLRMIPRNTGPSNYDLFRISIPDAKFSKLTLSSR